MGESGRPAQGADSTGPEPGAEDTQTASDGRARRRRRRSTRPATGGADVELPGPSADEQDRGWGEIPRRDDDWYERNRPPHHGD